MADEELRDLIAVVALHAFISDGAIVRGTSLPTLALYAFRVADVMLVERKRTPEQRAAETPG